MANTKSFTLVNWQKVTTQDLIGPVKAFHQVTGAGNMAFAAQVPKETNGQNADVDQDYILVFIISGVEQRCELIEESYSKEMVRRWIHKTNDRTDQTVPMTATERCMLDILEEPAVNNAELIRAWSKGARETPPTTASSVPAIPQLEIRRSDSLPAPEGAPKAYSPRPESRE